MADPKLPEGRKAYRRTKKQQEWIARWNRMTLYAFQDDTSQPFYRCADRNMEWLKEHISEVTMSAERELYEVTSPEERIAERALRSALRRKKRTEDSHV